MSKLIIRNRSEVITNTPLGKHHLARLSSNANQFIHTKYFVKS